MTYEIKEVSYTWHDRPDVIGYGRIAIGNVPEDLINDPDFDDHIFYYCATEEEYASLFDEHTQEDFYLIKESK